MKLRHLLSKASDSATNDGCGREMSPTDGVEGGKPVRAWDRKVIRCCGRRGSLWETRLGEPESVTRILAAYICMSGSASKGSQGSNDDLVDAHPTFDGETHRILVSRCARHDGVRCWSSAQVTVSSTLPLSLRRTVSLFGLFQGWELNRSCLK